MNTHIRFGRRLSLPSTRQIIHEMRVLEAEENRLKEHPPMQATSSAPLPTRTPETDR